jgi:hypothetical protein
VGCGCGIPKELQEEDFAAFLYDPGISGFMFAYVAYVLSLCYLHLAAKIAP